MNFSEQVQQSLDAILKSGKVEESINNALTKTIEGLIESALREYSDFGKDLKKAVNEALQINFSKVSTLGYQKIVTDIVNAKIAESVHQNIAGPLKERLDKVLMPFEIRTYKLSEIVQEFIADIHKDEGYGEIGLDVEESSYGYWHIRISETAKKNSYDERVNFSVNKSGEMYHFKLGNYSSHKGDILKESISGKFDLFIFNLYASQCKIEIDEHDCETEWGHDY